MRGGQYCLIFIMLAVADSVSSGGGGGAGDGQNSVFASATTITTKLSRSNFPDGFVFGAASSAYQYEGAANMDGRRPSIWDTFTKLYPEKILDHSTGDVADDSYHMFKEDIALIKDIGLDSYRFSISWPRILPYGKISKGINWEGVKFYNFLIDHLISNGIQPLVTLFHWDMPQALEDEYGGFLSLKVVEDFSNYVDFCFKLFGDRVKHWVTINEPNLFSYFGYGTGDYAPGRCSDYIGNCTEGNSATEPYIVVHHMLLCHATAVKLYRDKYKVTQNGIIGITAFTFWFEPKHETVASRNAASRGTDFLLGWILHPLTYGEYPESMQYLVGDRLPKFTKAQAEIVKGSIDFFGINYYTSRYADDVTSYSIVNLSYTTDSRVNLTYEKNGTLIGEPTPCSWIYMCPKGLREILMYVKEKYNNPTIYVTENGMADAKNNSLSLHEALNDSLRIDYHHLHLLYLLQSIKEGVDVKGYYIWSLLDNFEWIDGYTLRFGINFVDYKNGLKRYMKRSALWFKEFLRMRDATSTTHSLLYAE